MHPVLREDCARRGGCCGRDCGCCLHRPISASRKLGVGHCSIECGCCRKVRGFDLSTEQRTKYRKQFEFPVPGLEGEGRDTDQYYYRMYLASIWGLSNSSNENPLCLIDQFLRCDQVETGDQVTPLMRPVDEEGSESIFLI